MIMMYMKIVVAMIVLAQPASHRVDRGHPGVAVAVARSLETSSKPVPRPVKVAHHATPAPDLKAAVQVRAERQAKPNSSEAPRARAADPQPAANAAVESRAAQAYNAVPPPASAAAQDSSSNSDTKTTQQQVMAAMTVAELLTTFRAVPEPDQKATGTERLVAVVMARPDIKSVSDLAGKSVAIDGRQFHGNVRTAIVAAGAAAVQLSEDQTKAIDRLIGGEVPAAVLTLVSPEAAEKFPDVEGYRIFRVPLSPL
jgi:hypothetical protein